MLGKKTFDHASAEMHNYIGPIPRAAMHHQQSTIQGYGSEHHYPGTVDQEP